MADAFTVRAAETGDLQAVHALVERAYRGDAARRGWTHEADLLGGQRTDLQALADIVGAPSQRLLLLEADGQMLGCVQVADQGDGLAYLGMLSIEPASQAAGLGKRLIDAAEREAIRRFGADRIEMTVIRQRPELIAYYERRGFALTGEERPFPYGMPQFGEPKRQDLAFVVLSKSMSPTVDRSSKSANRSERDMLT